jgi:hypothetical protein
MLSADRRGDGGDTRKTSLTGREPSRAREKVLPTPQGLEVWRLRRSRATSHPTRRLTTLSHRPLRTASRSRIIRSTRHSMRSSPVRMRLRRELASRMSSAGEVPVGIPDIFRTIASPAPEVELDGIALTGSISRRFASYSPRARRPGGELGPGPRLRAPAEPSAARARGLLLRRIDYTEEADAPLLPTGTRCPFAGLTVNAQAVAAGDPALRL